MTHAEAQAEIDALLQSMHIIGTHAKWNNGWAVADCPEDEANAEMAAGKGQPVRYRMRCDGNPGGGCAIVPPVVAEFYRKAGLVELITWDEAYEWEKGGWKPIDPPRQLETLAFAAALNGTTPGSSTPFDFSPIAALIEPEPCSGAMPTPQPSESSRDTSSLPELDLSALSEARSMAFELASS